VPALVGTQRASAGLLTTVPAGPELGTLTPLAVAEAARAERSRRLGVPVVDDGDDEDGESRWPKWLQF
jgi:hypothetical protein